LYCRRLPDRLGRAGSIAGRKRLIGAEMRAGASVVFIAAAALFVGACGRHGCDDLVLSARAPRQPITVPELPHESYELSYDAGPTGRRALLPMTLHGRDGERRVQAVLDTGDPGDVTIGARLARLGEPLGPVTTMQSGTGPHRVCRVQFETITALGSSWTSPLVNANLDRCDSNASIGLGFFEGARGFIVDHGARRVTVLSGSGDGLEAAAQRGEWVWTPWRSSLTVGRTRELEGRPLTIETEWTFEANWPFVIVWVDGEPIPCIVDTGATLDLALGDARFFRGPTRPARATGHGGSVRGRAGAIGSVEVAGRRFDDVTAFVADNSTLTGPDGAVRGIIGMGLLARQPVWFDLEGGRIGFGTPAE
jgi:hypothetical protein